VLGDQSDRFRGWLHFQEPDKNNREMDLCPEHAQIVDDRLVSIEHA